MAPLAGADKPAALRALRQAAARARAHAIWWELGLGGDIVASYEALSAFADRLVAEALAAAEGIVSARFGELPGFAIAALALGKHGGEELNLGSDLDLVFVWDAPEGASSTRRGLGASEYAERVVRAFVELCALRTAEGLAWEVDLRLRPGGQAAPVALRLAAVESYFEDYAQAWERAAWIKARAVAGDAGLGKRLMQIREAFVFRPRLDWAMLDALAEMKRRIDAEAGTKGFGPGWDVKRGRGGIREVEFIAQALQLAYGGRYSRLRTRKTLKALARLSEHGFLPEEDAAQLQAAYCDLRRVEHALQARRGEHTHRLPDDAEVYLSAALGEERVRRVQKESAFVAERFAALFRREAE
ncbi:MAG: bifunctional [glutamate--ammonia ligase]-adenylyl-L-tyrosine phosphorylase/[glutamate--ammonia-ligase] adenylyltransferase, partial [Zetaproteobacteria bacterium]